MPDFTAIDFSGAMIAVVIVYAGALLLIVLIAFGGSLIRGVLSTIFFPFTGVLGVASSVRESKKYDSELNAGATARRSFWFRRQRVDWSIVRNVESSQKIDRALTCIIRDIRNCHNLHHRAARLTSAVYMVEAASYHTVERQRNHLLGMIEHTARLMEEYPNLLYDPLLVERAIFINEAGWSCSERCPYQNPNLTVAEAQCKPCSTLALLIHSTQKPSQHERATQDNVVDAEVVE